MYKNWVEILLFLPLSDSDLKKIRGIEVMYQPLNSFNTASFASSRFSGYKGGVVR